MKNIIIALSILVAGFVIGLYCRPKGCSSTTIVQRDTTVVRDTLTIAKPTAATQARKGIIPVFVTDTIRIKDSIYIALPMETKIYKGEDYYAEVSGYKPSLDVLQIYPKTEYITEKTREIIRHRNYLAVGAEFGYVDDVHTYIYAEYKRMLHKNVGLYGRVMHDLSSGCNGVSMGIEAQIGW